MSRDGKKTGGGSRKGIPNKATKALKDMILGALDDLGGEAYLIRQATANPAAFLALLGKVLPTTLEGRVEIGAGLAEAIAAARARNNKRLIENNSKMAPDTGKTLSSQESINK